jgi:hypothetical protein
MVPQGNGAAWIKLDLLSHGIQIGESAREALREIRGIATRKNFYNSPVWDPGGALLPQEVVVLGCIVGANAYGSSPWLLECSSSHPRLILKHNTGEAFDVHLLTDLQVFTRQSRAARIANLYGGGALAFFSPRACYFFADGTQCTFCSLAGTAEESSEFQGLLSADDVRFAVRAALETDRERIEQIMVVGGNMRDLDRGFEHHMELAKAAESELRAAGVEDTTSVHVATMPPRNLELLTLAGDFVNLHVMFNLEVWDATLFRSICPGKHKDYGREGILTALDRLARIMSPYRVHSLLVTGLEPTDSTIAGATALANMGVSPIINIYHSDRFSLLGLSVRPSFSYLASVARGLQDLYARFPIQPYWRNCGRNAIDAEAQRGLFREAVPQFLFGGT